MKEYTLGQQCRGSGNYTVTRTSNTVHTEETNQDNLGGQKLSQMPGIETAGEVLQPLLDKIDDTYILPYSILC